MFNCETCTHSAPAPTDPKNIGAPKQMECRRYPPQVLALPVNTMQGMMFAPAACFPVVANAQYCGEYAQKLAEKH